MYRQFGIPLKLTNLLEEVERDIQPEIERINEIVEYNGLKVIKAFQKHNLSEAHLNSTTGYGYDDIGREIIEKIYAEIFNAEDALVRVQFVNGTHALSVMLTGILRPNDKMLSVVGKPYDTLDETIKYLKEFGIKYGQVDLNQNGEVDFDSISKEIKKEKVKLVHIQRSKGYAWRKSLDIETIKNIIKKVKEIDEEIICVVDNCYGEFVEKLEPTDVGADLVAGSLIKNIGGGIALTGGYIVGKRNLIEECSYRLTAPGIGKECGATLGQNRNMLLGMFLSPNVVGEALKGAIFGANILSKIGYDVMPKPKDTRTDIIQSVKFNDEEKLIKFCQGIQMASPVDSFAIPSPWDMPGYSDKVIMAAGAFTQGSSIEMSADAPIRAPYICYIQGGLTYTHAKLSYLKAISNMEGELDDN